jgi:hypothetical protein
MEGYCGAKGGARYSAFSERKFREFPKMGLRHIRMPSGTLRFKYSWIDEFLDQYEVCESNEVDQIVGEVMRDLR